MHANPGAAADDSVDGQAVSSKQGLSGSVPPLCHNNNAPADPNDGHSGAANVVNPES